MEQEILDKIKDTLSDALGVETDEVQMDSSLTRDLGAESIDFIDIVFRLEKTFEIKIPSGDLFPGNILSNEQFLSAGKVTEAGLNELREKLPYLDVDAFAQDPDVTKLGDYFTVKMIVDYLKDRLSKDAASA